MRSDDRVIKDTAGQFLSRFFYALIYSGRSGFLHIDRIGSFFAILHFVFHPVAFPDLIRQSAGMDENILAGGVILDESEFLFGVVEFYGTLHFVAHMERFVASKGSFLVDYPEKRKIRPLGNRF
jgi:hypothetical protein